MSAKKIKYFEKFLLLPQMLEVKYRKCWKLRHKISTSLLYKDISYCELIKINIKLEREIVVIYSHFNSSVIHLINHNYWINWL